MTIDVLGLGESIKEFTPKGNITIGVNDVAKHFVTDKLVVVDKPEKFTKERLQTIVDHRCIMYTHLKEWLPYRKVKLIDLAFGRGNLNDIESERFCYSNNSTFVAVVLAYKLGATKINIFGADFNNHPNLDTKTVLIDFKKLFDYLKGKRVEITVTKGSQLNKLIYPSTSV
jgi:hypothetical protein